MHKGHIVSSLRKRKKTRSLLTRQRKKFPRGAEAKKLHHYYSKGPIRDYLNQLPTPINLIVPNPNREILVLPGRLSWI